MILSCALQLLNVNLHVSVPGNRDNNKLSIQQDTLQLAKNSPLGPMYRLPVYGHDGGRMQPVLTSNFSGFFSNIAHSAQHIKTHNVGSCTLWFRFMC